MNGPSVVSVRPSWTRTVVAVSARWSCALPRTPGSRVSAKYSFVIAFRSLSSRRSYCSQAAAEWISSRYFISFLLGPIVASTTNGLPRSGHRATRDDYLTRHRHAKPRGASWSATSHRRRTNGCNEARRALHRHLERDRSRTPRGGDRGGLDRGRGVRRSPGGRRRPGPDLRPDRVRAGAG